uniref:NADH dehydrogenase subunit 4 n=1 Tax=Uroobovella oviformis TaxID=3106009 RepID=UPI002E79DB9F|nr:NADH dehydrogenase subunit 4 [Uroobovella oviformis]WPV72079.1 NADH dehydrogenase subunit 4 [Uroobovella oviformis]
MKIIIVIFLVNFLGINLLMYLYLFMIIVMILVLLFNWDLNIFVMSYWGGLDLMSYLFIFLSYFIMILMRLSVSNYNIWNSFMYNLLEIMIFMMLVLSFFVFNLLGFFIFFESVLIPIIFIIYFWGLNMERMQAGLYLLMYTMFGSLPMFLVLLYMCMNMSVSYILIDINDFMCFGVFYNFFLVLLFLVKMPMFILHLWLPSAHVEAPVSGSMILAGVLLKLGGYGLFRFMSVIMSDFNYFNIMVVFVLIGGLITSFYCMIQNDIKTMIAYSSIVHMSVVMAGLFSLSLLGMKSMMLMMMAHGLCSSGLFYMVNIYYEHVGSRSIMMLSGMGKRFLYFMSFWFLMCCLNFGLPISVNYMSEVGLMISVISFSYFFVIIIMLISFMSACYSLYIFSYICHGMSWINYFKFMIVNREYLISVSHIIPMFLLIMKGDMLLI